MPLSRELWAVSRELSFFNMSMKIGNVRTRSQLNARNVLISKLTTRRSLLKNSKICGHLSHRRYLRAIIEWWVSWQLTPKNTKTHRNEVGFVLQKAWFCHWKRPFGGCLGVFLQDFTKTQNLISLNISVLQLNLCVFANLHLRNCFRSAIETKFHCAHFSQSLYPSSVFQRIYVPLHANFRS